MGSRFAQSFCGAAKLSESILIKTPRVAAEKSSTPQRDSSPLIEFFAALTIAGLLTYARLQIKAGTLTAGEFTSFVIALLMLYEPVKRLTGIQNIFQQAAGASQTVFQYLDGDQLVSPSQTLLMFNALRAKGIDATRYVLDGANHGDQMLPGMSETDQAPWSNTQTMGYIVSFLNKKLHA